MSEEKKEGASKDEVIFGLAKDLVETAFQIKKVLAVCSVPYTHIEETRLLGAVADQILASYTKPKAEKEDNDEREEKMG